MSDAGLGDLAREAAVQMSPSDDGAPAFRRRQAYITAIASDWLSASIKFPESTTAIPGIRFMYPGMPPAVGDTVWIDQNGPDTVISSAVGLPMGVVEDLDGRLPVPSGWLICDGRSTSGYPLAAYMSTTPDLRDKFMVGSGLTYSVGQTGGEATHVLGSGEVPGHQHTIPNHQHTQTAHSHGVPIKPSGSESGGYGLDVSAAFTDRVLVTGGSTSSDAGGAQLTAADGGGGSTAGGPGSASAHENRPPFYAVVRIIKAV